MLSYSYQDSLFITVFNYHLQKKYKLLGLNLNPTKDNPIHNYIEKSYVQEINGHKYGIIGLVPPDLHIHVKLQDHLKDLNIEQDFKKSIPEVQKEVDKLQAQGINKIIVLSHSGYRQDVQLAKNVKGIDVILGAHTHTLLEGIEENKNLFYSSTGEPIIITQAGRDGKNFGVLNVEFDKNGVITKVQNNIGTTDQYNRNLVARDAFETTFAFLLSVRAVITSLFNTSFCSTSSSISSMISTSSSGISSSPSSSRFFLIVSFKVSPKSESSGIAAEPVRPILALKLLIISALIALSSMSSTSLG